MDLRDYYDRHWTELPEGQVDYKRLSMIVERVQAGERVLEAGCGPGFLAKLLKDKGAHVIGTDVSRVGAERTARRGIETHHVDLDTTKLPFPDQSFDTVVCNSNLEHLFFLEQNLAECIRVLRLGGKFIWMEPNTAHWRYRLWLLFGRFPYIPESPTDPYHIRHVTAHELVRLCRANGLEVREPVPSIFLTLILQNLDGTRVLFSDVRDTDPSVPERLGVGPHTFEITIPHASARW